jgi:microsomal dipeptidase-like Zn-dependent dipeptidase
MIVDLHAHYPMHVLADVTPRSAYDQIRQIRGRSGVSLKERTQALIVWGASLLFNDRDLFSGYRIQSPESLRDGGVGVAMSVLYEPFEEANLGNPYGSPPDPSYFPKLLENLKKIEDEVSTHSSALVRLVHNRSELESALKDEALALVHSVEGGFSVGDGSDSEIDANVATLAEKGVAYVTVAHLLYRQVATNAPALPFMKDSTYNHVFPQPEGEGLTKGGIALVRAMVKHRVLIDISHMRPDAVAETFRVLDEDDVDPKCEMPVVATHAGYRFGEQEYMLDRETILQIKRRNGVVGVIMAQHQLNENVLPKGQKLTKSWEEAFGVICKHIDKIVEITEGFEHVALGTDFDGFIKPTMTGLDKVADLTTLDAALKDKYKADAERITSGNALRVLRQLWPPSASAQAPSRPNSR